MESEPSPQQIRIVIIDDHVVVRAALCMLIESHPNLKVVGEAGNYAEALAAVKREQPDIIILDIVMGGESGLDYIPQLLEATRQSRILILTGVNDAGKIQRAVQLGAMGVVFKEKAPEVLIKAIKKIRLGEAWLDRVTVGSMLAEMSRPSRNGNRDSQPSHVDSLTKRERDIITLVAQGLKNKQIASQLRISDITVRHHLTSIFGKLFVADRYELIIYAYRQKLCDPPVDNSSQQN
jgi:two-component system nitrate/nitrite response regulator NarL